MRCPPKEENHENEKSPLRYGGAEGRSDLFSEKKKADILF